MSRGNSHARRGNGASHDSGRPLVLVVDDEASVREVLRLRLSSWGYSVLLARDGTPKLMDLGLAKGPIDLGLTQHGATVGTPQYISPEQAVDPRKADTRSDIYGLGATLYAMLCGEPPFDGQTLRSAVMPTPCSTTMSPWRWQPARAAATVTTSSALRKCIRNPRPILAAGPSPFTGQRQPLERRG